MVHLIYIRDCKDFVYGDNLKYGSHQQIERNIANSRYELNDIRKGYNIPFTTELHLINTRLKKEVLSAHARDLNAINFNPSPNNMTLYKVFTTKRSISESYSVGFTFKLIIWLFKWINKKRVTPIILFLLGLFTLQFWLWLIAIIIKFNPLKPVPVKEQITNNLRGYNWSYHYILGYLEDPTEKLEDGTNKERYQQEDVL